MNPKTQAVDICSVKLGICLISLLILSAAISTVQLPWPLASVLVPPIVARLEVESSGEKKSVTQRGIQLILDRTTLNAHPALFSIDFKIATGDFSSEACISELLQKIVVVHALTFGDSISGSVRVAAAKPAIAAAKPWPN